MYKKKAWNKLDNFQKKKKLLEYFNDLLVDKIEPCFGEGLKKILLNKLKEGKLKSIKQVDYDSSLMKINKIGFLQINDNKTFKII